MVDWDPPSDANISSYHYRLLINGTEQVVVDDTVVEVPLYPVVNTSLRIDVFTYSKCNQSSDSIETLSPQEWMRQHVCVVRDYVLFFVLFLPSM